MNALILAAGRGERMRPLSDTTPKPLLHVKHKPLILWQIERLKACGITQMVINIDYLGQQIVDTLGDGSAFGVTLNYSDERESGALESAGGIKKALSLLDDETFVVVNADIWCDYRFDASFELGSDLAHLIMVSNPEHNRNGDFALESGRLRNEGATRYTFSGIGYYRPALFDTLTCNKAPLAPLLREAAQNDRIGATLFKGVWSDIGTPQRLEALENSTRLLAKLPDRLST